MVHRTGSSSCVHEAVLADVFPARFCDFDAIFLFGVSSEQNATIAWGAMVLL